MWYLLRTAVALPCQCHCHGHDGDCKDDGDDNGDSDDDDEAGRADGKCTRAVPHCLWVRVGCYVNPGTQLGLADVPATSSRSSLNDVLRLVG